MGDLAGGVPGGTRRQLRLLQEHDVGPAFMGEMIGKAAAHDAAADNDHLCSGRHGSALF